MASGMICTTAERNRQSLCRPAQTKFYNNKLNRIASDVIQRWAIQGTVIIQCKTGLSVQVDSFNYTDIQVVTQEPHNTVIV